MLTSLIAVAAVANLDVSVANVGAALHRHVRSSQTTLHLIAVGYSLGLAASVLCSGALGDRYGRKLMLVLGMVLSVPACLVAAYAPSDTVLFGGPCWAESPPAWPTTASAGIDRTAPACGVRSSTVSDDGAMCRERDGPKHPLSG